MQGNISLFQFIKTRPWVTVKFLLLFTALSLFISYNFGIGIGIPLSTVVTLFSIINWRIFDKASDVFLI